MKKHYSYILITLFFTLFTGQLCAQPYYTLPQWGASGTYPVGDVNVSFNYSGTAGLGGCWGVNWTEKNNGYFTFNFDVPIAGVRIYGVDWDQYPSATQNIAVSINGNPYNLQTANLSPYSYGNSCSAGSRSTQGTISGGNFINGCGTLTITQPGITSLKVQNSGNGYWGFSVEILPLLTTTNTPCAGSELNLTSNFGGLTSGVTYSWTGPNGFTSSQQNPTISNATAANAGIYTVTASNGTVTASQTRNVYVNPIPVVNNVNNQTLCNGSSVNTINFSSNTTGVLCGSVNEGGTLSLSAPAGSVFTNVQFASYGNATGSCGNFTLGSCHSTNSVSLVSAAAVGQNSFSLAATNANFGDPCTGTAKDLKVQLSYGIPITYLWTNNLPSIGLAASGTGNIPAFVATNVTNAPVTATITVTPRYINGGSSCFGTPITFTITVNPSPKITVQPISQTTCNGSNTTFSATVSNATDYQWQVDPGSGFINMSDTAPYSGTTTTSLAITGVTSSMNGYKYRLIATGSCTPTVTSTDAILTVPSITGTTIVANVLCNGSSNGSINLTPSGGTGPYTFNWGGGITTEDRTGLAAGNYSVTITDANGCTGTVNATVSQPSVLTASTNVVSNVSVIGGTDGSATVSAFGGLAPYTYLWSNSATTASITSIAAGTYTVIVTDAIGCTATSGVTITEPVCVMSASITSQTNVTCNGESTGSLTVQQSGGDAPFSYSWSNGISLLNSPSSTNTQNDLAAGSYTVIITDANGCTATATATITQPSALSLSQQVTVNILCHGTATGSASVKAATGGAGGYTYNWTPGNPTGDGTTTVTGLTAGTWTCTVTDANGCTKSVNFTLNQPSAISLTPASQTNIACHGTATGSASVSTATGGAGGYTYNWTPGNPTGDGTTTVTGLTAGTWTCTVMDMFGCTKSVNFTITQPASTVSGDTVVTNVLCNGDSNGSINLTPLGGTEPYTFNWGDGITTEDRTGLPVGNYSVMITDANGCTGTVNATVTQPSVLTASGVVTNVGCNGGSNGTVDLTVNGGTAPYTFAWSNSATTEDMTGLMAGTYDVTVTDAHGCTATTSVTITEPALLVAGTVVDTNVSCNGGSTGTATINLTGGTAPFEYTINGTTYSGVPDATLTVPGLAAGTYPVNVTDANGCTATASITITEPAVLAASGVATNVSCNGGSNGTVDLTVTGGTAPYTYVWSNTAVTEDLTGLSAGTYDVTVTDALGCTATASVTVTEPTVLTANISSQTNVGCNGGTTGAATVTAAGGTTNYTYSWAPSGGTAATATGLAAGTYTVTVTDANGCTATASVTITEPTLLTASAVVNTNVSCNGGSNGSATVTAAGGTTNYTYSWAPSGGTAATATGLAAGTYTVTVTDANGCTATASVTITQPAVLTAYAVQNFPATCVENLDGGATVTAAGGTTPYTYAWDNSATTAAVTNLSVGSRTVTVTDANGCTATATLTIGFNDTVNPTPTVANLADITAQCVVNEADVPVPTATDNCIGTITVTHNATFPITLQGTTVITWTYEDVNGNTATQTQNVVIDDTTAPVGDVTNLLAITMQCQVLTTDIPVPTATDNCAGALTATTTDPLLYTTVGNYVITWSYDDGNGNITTQTQDVIVTESAINAVTFTSQTVVYNTAAQAITVDNLPAGATVAYTISPDTGLGNAAINTGVYTVTAVVTPAPDAPNCDPITLTATLTIEQAQQQIIFDALPVKNLEADPDFQLTATATSGLPVYYTYTYTAPTTPATVTADGWVDMLTSGVLQITAHQDGDSNYLPAVPVTQEQVITSSDSSLHLVTIGDTEYVNPTGEVYYLMQCVDTADEVTVTIETEVGAAITPGHTFTIATPQPGIYHQEVVVTSQDGTTTQTYTITVEKMFPFFDIAVQKFDNLLLANNNPQTNGGYSFVAYEWYKNGQLVGRHQYYSEGPTNNDLLDPDAEYYLRLTTVDGDVLQTCIGLVTLEHSYRMSVMPNPARVAGEVTVTLDFPSAEMDNVRIDIFDIHGKLIHSSNTSQRITPVQLPGTLQEGMYIVRCITANHEKSFKIIVSN
ncbi:T9SS type A sorting domain-containing protein [Flavobacterium rakeshii]|uniref:T9SS type A sorting domain-containing protein n=1 Tax=Flavobacterium rakeshii TaxID=1038845 RepID=A0A6N8HG11_9FLAO|nr:T9SS type A sorting domain-containing protein [Flavobacterium rakeshii]MUV04669.1 T9SS type A sorting domain-containing protein [Flavobacterium rakeshii]